MKNFKVSLSSVLSYHIPVQEQHRRKTKRAQFDETSESLLEFKGLQSGSQVVESSEENNQRIDCNVSEWSPWSPCIRCRGFTISTRKIFMAAKGKGKSCPKKLLRKRKCRKIPPCSEQINRRVNESKYNFQ